MVLLVRREHVSEEFESVSRTYSVKVCMDCGNESVGKPLYTDVSLQRLMFMYMGIVGVTGEVECHKEVAGC